MWITMMFLIGAGILCMCGSASAPLAPDQFQSGDFESHRRGDEVALEAALSLHRSRAEEEVTSARIAVRRRIHDEHIRAHLTEDPDVPTEATEEVRQQFLASRKRLFEASSKPTGGLRLVLLIAMATLPMFGFIVWMKF